MRVESSVTSITWIPSEAIEGMPKLPFEWGVAHYDEPPHDRLTDLDALQENDLSREANELKAWIEVDDDGKITDAGYTGGGRIGVTRLKLGRREIAFPAVQYPLLQAEPEVRDGEARFVQSAGGHMGLPAARRVRGEPFMRISLASAGAKLELVRGAGGSAGGPPPDPRPRPAPPPGQSLVRPTPPPRHWVYDADGVLAEKSASIDFER